MPVLTEPTAQERKRGRGWLWLLAAVPVLLVLFLVGTTIRPLVVETGGRVVFVGGTWGELPGQRDLFLHVRMPPPGTGTVHLRDARVYLQTGDLEAYYLCLPHWVGAVFWFKGRRAP